MSNVIEVINGLVSMYTPQELRVIGSICKSEEVIEEILASLYLYTKVDIEYNKVSSDVHKLTTYTGKVTLEDKWYKRNKLVSKIGSLLVHKRLHRTFLTTDNLYKGNLTAFINRFTEDMLDHRIGSRNIGTAVYNSRVTALTELVGNLNDTLVYFGLKHCGHSKLKNYTVGEIRSDADLWYDEHLDHSVNGIHFTPIKHIANLLKDRLVTLERYAPLAGDNTPLQAGIAHMLAWVYDRNTVIDAPAINAYIKEAPLAYIMALESLVPNCTSVLLKYKEMPISDPWKNVAPTATHRSHSSTSK